MIEKKEPKFLDSNSHHSISEVLDEAKVLVVLGPGGVGKTTTSLALAIGEAKKGKKVALLSIDPAKRLADALGIALGTEPRPVEFEESLGIKGTLDAAMIDQKAIFDQMVGRFVHDEVLRNKIFNHPLYLALSTNLAGPLEYVSLAKLHELFQSSDYDVVVLDTPPDSQALDFLARPNLLAGFMEKKVIHWLIKPFHLANKLGFNKVLSLGERLMGGVAQVTGVDALKNLAEFVVLMQQVIEGFHHTGQDVLDTLHRQDARFLLITKPSYQGGRTAVAMAEQLYEMSFDLHGVMVNRCFPAEVANELTQLNLLDNVNTRQITKQLHEKLQGQLSIVENVKDRLENIYGKMVPVWKLKEQTRPLHNAKAMVELADEIILPT